MLVVGESLVDIVHAADGSTDEYAGGSAANVAVALSRLGRPVRFVTAWADDARGRMLAEHLAAAGVELASDPLVLGANRDGGGDDRRGRVGVVRVRPRLADRRRSSRGRPVAVHVCSIGAVLEPGADEVLRPARRAARDARRSATTSTPAPRSPAPVPTWSRGSSGWSPSRTW